MRILILAAVAIFLVFLVRAFIDVARRRDLPASSKAGWVLVLLLLLLMRRAAAKPIWRSYLPEVPPA